MAKKQEKEIERWVTVNGARVPIFKDGSVGGPKALRDKVKAVVKEKSSDGKSLKDMSATDIGKEYLTATGERKKALLKELHDRGYRRNKDGSWGKKESDKSGVIRKEKGTKLSENPYTKKAMDDMGLAGKKWEKLTDSQKQAVAERASELEDRATKRQAKKSKDNNTKEKQIASNKSSAKKVPEHITSAKNMSELNDKLKAHGLSMESADASDIKSDYRSMNGEKVSLYDKDGNEYRGTFNRYSDGGTEIVNIKKERYNTKEDDTKEKQIANNNKTSHYSESMLKDEEFRKDALKEMRRYEENWKGMSANDRRNIAPGGIKEVRERIKELENYDKQAKQTKEQKTISDNENLKEKQIARNKAEKDKLNGKKEASMTLPSGLKLTSDVSDPNKNLDAAKEAQAKYKKSSNYAKQKQLRYQQAAKAQQEKDKQLAMEILSKAGVGNKDNSSKETSNTKLPQRINTTIKPEHKVSYARVRKEIDDYPVGTYLKYSTKGNINDIGPNTYGVVKVGPNHWVSYGTLTGYGNNRMTSQDIKDKLYQRKAKNIGVKLP